MKKIALVFICLNPQYWPYLKQVVEDAREKFLKGHQLDIFAWSDITEESVDSYISANRAAFENKNGTPEEEFISMLDPFVWFLRNVGCYDIPYVNERLKLLAQEAQITIQPDNGTYIIGTPQDITHDHVVKLQAFVDDVLEHTYGSLKEFIKTIKVFETESVQWPLPTLMRYHLFLQQEEKLKEYDYVFYLDADMRVVDDVGDEILGEGLTMAEHPMYSLSRRFVPPYEPNPQSEAYIKRLGVVLTDEYGKKYFKPLYAAGGFQGGAATAFIEAMKEMRKAVDKDFASNYIAIWNDESHWNKYLSDYIGHLTVLSPAYVYPDSLIEEYYTKIWGVNYKPRIVTLTKPFTTSKEAANATKKTLNEFKEL